MTPSEHDQARQPDLKAFLDNELPPWRRLAVRLHLARCASCREEMQAMQQTGNELRGQTTIDPLDPGLRSRILATVREMTPEPAAPAHPRRPVLMWGGAAFAALLLVAVFASRPRFAADFKSGEASLAASPPAASIPGSVGSPEVTDKAAESPASGSAAPALSRTYGGGSFSGSVASKLKTPQTKEMRTEKHIASAGRSSSKPENSVAMAAPEAQSIAGDRVYDQAKKVAAPPPVLKRQASARQSSVSNAYNAPSKGRRQAAVVSPRVPQTHDSLSGNRLKTPQEPVILDHAGFDINGYQFVTQGGQQISVPFKKSLNAVRFARATDGRMALTESVSPPILYLTPADSLVNDAVPGARWQPLPPALSSTQAFYVRPARDWEQFAAMRWYPNMTVVGGFTNDDSTSAAFTWLPGSHVQIGATLYPDFAAYRAYADAHPDALRLHAVYDSHDTLPPATPAPEAAKAAGSARGKSHR
jgi:anti-sigma factor RsiW